MKKLKKLWQNNTILFILGIILIACVIAILVVGLIYFVGDSDTKFGDRLDGMEEHIFTSEAKDNYIAKFKELALEENLVSIKVEESQTRTIYVIVE